MGQLPVVQRHLQRPGAATRGADGTRMRGTSHDVFGITCTRRWTLPGSPTSTRALSPRNLRESPVEKRLQVFTEQHVGKFWYFCAPNLVLQPPKSRRLHNRKMAPNRVWWTGREARSFFVRVVSGTCSLHKMTGCTGLYSRLV